MFIDQWSNIWSIIHSINLLGVCRVEDVCLVSQRRKVFIIGKKRRICMVIAGLVSRLTVKWNEEMFTVISKSFLEPSNLMCSSCRPTLLPTMEEFRSWCLHLAFWPVPRLLLELSTLLPSGALLVNAPMFTPSLNLLFATLLLEKPNPLFSPKVFPSGICCLSHTL